MYYPYPCYSNFKGAMKNIFILKTPNVLIFFLIFFISFKLFSDCMACVLSGHMNSNLGAIQL